ncbi:MAG: hypothetical protein ACRC0R_03080, partial [Cetobacterium sp.]
LRIGAQVAISSSKEIIESFSDASLHTCRSVWSNIPKGGMILFGNIISNDEKYTKLLSEQNDMKNMLKNRTDIFLKEAADVGLEISPYKSGFFITIPFKKYSDKEIEKKLNDENIFTILIPGAIRLAICSIPKHKIYGLAHKIKSVVS